MVKKIIIIILLLVALFFVVFQPGEIHSMIDGLRQEMGGFWGYVFAFYIASSTLLFWIGVPAGWNFAKENFWGLGGALICAFIGLYLSVPIAIFQLLKPTN